MTTECTENTEFSAGAFRVFRAFRGLKMTEPPLARRPSSDPLFRVLSCFSWPSLRAAWLTDAVNRRACADGPNRETFTLAKAKRRGLRGHWNRNRTTVTLKRHDRTSQRPGGRARRGRGDH